jgi:hypothetical protein
VHRGAGTDNPYSAPAVDIVQTIRTHELTLSPSIVAYLKMLFTLGTLRHQLAPDYDLPQTVRRLFEAWSGGTPPPGSARGWP